KPKGILTANNDQNYSDTSEFRNNKVVFKDTIPANWQTTMIGMAQITKIVTGNTASSLLPSIKLLPVTVPITAWGTTANGYVYIPHDYAVQKSCPVVIFFHGVGEAGTDPTKLLNQGLPKLLNDGMKLD